MKKRLILFLAVLASFVFQEAKAQDRLITGTVTSKEDTAAVIGATVTIKGTVIATTTDISGMYKLSVPENAKTLVISAAFMKTQEVEIGSNTVVDVVLETDLLKLDEVVVTAIGIKQEKKRVGYSIQEVSGDDITKTGQTNMVGGISGKVAGAQVISSSGSPGGSVFIKLRGTTSLTGDNQPLFVIDGVPFDNSMQESGNPDNGTQNNLTTGVGHSNRGIDINPDDIENITVLKGPAATALYGISASNGALIITTKKGGHVGPNKLNVTYSSSVIFDKVSRLPELQNKYVQGSGGVYAGPLNHGSGSWGSLASDMSWNGDASYQYDTHGDLVLSTDPTAKTKFVPYDNMKSFFQTGVTTENSVSLSGGDDKNSFRFSASQLGQDGVVPLSDFKRTTLKIGGQSKITNKFKVSGSVSYTNSGGRRVQQGSNVSGLMLGLTRTPISFDNSNGATDPSDPKAYIFADGTQRNYRGNRGYDNPFWTINENQFKDQVNRMFGYTELGYDALSWLNLTYRLGTDFYSDRRKQFYGINSRAYTAGQIFEDQYYYQHVNSDFIARATHKITDDINGNFILGQNLYSQTYQQLYVQGDGLNFPDFYNLSNAQSILSRETSNRYRRSAIYADASFDYKNYLYLDLTARDEKSSTLPTSHNRFFYPSSSLAFVFTEPLHMDGNKYFPYGKLRISYAQVGKDAPAYATQSYYTGAGTVDGFTSGIFFPFNGIGGYTKSGLLGNPNLRPEKTNSFETGTDLRFFGNRVGLDVTYYASKSIDQIFSVPISGASGYTNIVLNAGSIQNKGWEVALNITPVKTKNFKWDLGFNWSRNRNKVLALADGVDRLTIGGFQGSEIAAVVGQPYGLIYGGRWLRNADGKVIIDDNPLDADYGKPVVDGKEGVIGNINPKWIGGISNTFTYKRFALFTLIDIKHGGDIWNGTRGALTFIGTAKGTENRGETKVFEGVKQSDGSTNDIVTTLDQNWYQGNGGGFGSQAEGFVEDGSYVRLREVSLSYSIKPEKLKKIKLNGLEFSLFARNLILITKYQGVDPETSLTGAGNSQGMDYFNMPGTKSYGIRLKVTL